jgi:SNF2 family DNA or RNA helicase
MLLKNNTGYSELNGSIPANKRGNLIKQIESDDNCKVFLSTEAGGAGLNLQVADILINFELPWNPAKKPTHWPYRSLGTKKQPTHDLQFHYNQLH